MASRKEYFGKYYSSDIFNLIQKSPIDETKPKLRLNRSTLENTKEDLFNIRKEKRINRNENKDIYFNNSAEKRKINYEKIYGSDIFNLRAKSVEKRNGRHHMPNIANKSTCFEEMKNNEEYIKEFKQYTKEKRGDDDNKYNIKTMENINKNELKYIKRRKTDIESQNNKGLINHNKNSNSILNFRKKHPLTLYSTQKRHFVDLDECRENNCAINKQLQFESYLFSNQDNNYIKSQEDINEINARINKRKHTPNNFNILGQPIIRVNRKKNFNDNIHSSMCELHPKKIGPSNMTWDNPSSEVMYSPDYTKNLYKNYGPKGPTAYQRRLHQFADSDNLDTLSGLKKNYGNNFKNVKKPKTDEIKNKEEQKKIEKILEGVPNLSEGKKILIKMNSSILDFNDDKELEKKTKDLNNFLKKEKTKKKEITDKINHIDNKKIANNKNFDNYIITYGIREGNNFEKYNENEIKNIFGKKGINVYDIHKNNFARGKSYNTIELKIAGNNINNELNKKIKLIQDDLIKKNCKVKIEKIKKSNNIKKTVTNPGGKIAIMKENIINKKEENKYKMMPNEYKTKSNFTKQFSGINYSYKNPYLLY